jgi:hypothetical protein
MEEWRYSSTILDINTTLSKWSASCSGLGSFCSFLNLYQSVGLHERGISPSQGRYLDTEQHKHRINLHSHGLNGIRTRDPTVRACEDCSCLRPKATMISSFIITDVKFPVMSQYRLKNFMWKGAVSYCQKFLFKILHDSFLIKVPLFKNYVGSSVL